MCSSVSLSHHLSPHQGFRKLKELGFSDDDVLAALQVARNNFNQAVRVPMAVT